MEQKAPLLAFNPKIGGDIAKTNLNLLKRTVVKKGAGERVSEVLSYAYEISNDKRFVKMLVAENGLVTIDRAGVTGDIGFCQISPYYHPQITNDKRFLTDWKWQINKCYELYKNGTRFYGLGNIHKVEHLLEFNKK